MKKDVSAQRPTKGLVLNAIATVFDPQGITSSTFMANVPIQGIFKEKLDWDDLILENKFME